jgi:hypothetical protein
LPPSSPQPILQKISDPVVPLCPQEHQRIVNQGDEKFIIVVCDVETSSSHRPPNGAPISYALSSLDGKFQWHTYINPDPPINPVFSTGWGITRTWSEKASIIHKISPLRDDRIVKAPKLTEALQRIWTVITNDFEYKKDRKLIDNFIHYYI